MCGALPPTLFGGFLRTGALFVTTGSLVGRFWYVGTMLGRIWEPLGRFLGFFWVPWEQQGNHSSWGNGPRATIPPRGMVPFGTSWASRLTFLVQTLISLVRLVPKMFTKVHILVPKRTIPLGGMVALGPFPQEEWFPPPLIWHRKGRQRGEHRRRKTKNRTSFEFENMKSMSLETRFQLQACLLVYKDLPQGCFPV